MGKHSIRCCILLAVYLSALAATAEQQPILDSSESTIFDCIASADFTNQSGGALSSECQQAFEIYLPAQDNIVRFLTQFEDDVQLQAQEALRAAFVRMLRDDESVRELSGQSETASAGRIPDSIPTELRHEILKNMLNGKRFRASPVLRARLHSIRNLLLSQQNYAAAYWIERLLKLPDVHQHTPRDRSDTD